MCCVVRTRERERERRRESERERGVSDCCCSRSVRRQTRRQRRNSLALGPSLSLAVDGRTVGRLFNMPSAILVIKCRHPFDGVESSKYFCIIGVVFFPFLPSYTRARERTRDTTIKKRERERERESRAHHAPRSHSATSLSLSQIIARADSPWSRCRMRIQS